MVRTRVIARAASHASSAFAPRLIPRFGPGIPRFLSSGQRPSFVYFRTMAGFVLVWWLGSLMIGNPVLMPTPLAVAQALVDLVLNGELAQNILVSLQRLAISFGLACLIGIPLGLIIGLSVLARDAFEPLVEMLRPISGIAWVPLGLYMVGVGDALPILIMFYGAVFPLVLNTAAGVQGADRHLVQAARTSGRRTVARFSPGAAAGDLPQHARGRPVGSRRGVDVDGCGRDDRRTQRPRLRHRVVSRVADDAEDACLRLYNWPAWLLARSFAARRAVLADPVGTSGRRMTTRMAFLRPVAVPVALIAIWQSAAMGLPPHSRTPIPSQVFESAWRLCATGELPFALGLSLTRVFAGFFCAAVIALLLGAMMGYFRGVGRNLDPLIEKLPPYCPHRVPAAGNFVVW